MSLAQAVLSQYALAATSGISSSQAGVRAVAAAFGYSPGELDAIPGEANLGLSCGNPTAFASLKSGETVVDLGCGGGLDVFLAARRVGPDRPGDRHRHDARNARLGPQNAARWAWQTSSSIWRRSTACRWPMAPSIA